MQNPNVKILKKQVQDYFSKTDNLQEKTIFQFFSKEIKSKDLMGVHSDIPVLGKSIQKRKYLLALWRISNYSQTIPWIRLALPSSNTTASLELILPVFHGDMPKLWSKGKSYFRLVLQYNTGKHGPMFRIFTNQITIQDLPEILEIVTKFHRKIKTYGSLVK